MEFHNRFQALTEEGESATERYGKFVKANEGAAEECMEKVPKQRKKVRVASDPRVILAREEMVKAYSVQLKDCSDTCRDDYNYKKKVLYQTYDIIEEEELASKIREVEEAHLNQKYNMSWKLINDISARGSSKHWIGWRQSVKRLG